MATNLQVEANRLNTQKSAGPRSIEGQAASRFNGQKFGLEAQSIVIPGEDPAELVALACDYHRQFNPVGPLEDYLVDTLVHGHWNRRRYARIEGQLLRVLIANQDPSVESPLGAMFETDAAKANSMQKIFRLRAVAERNYFRALSELRRAQRERLSQDSEPETVQAVSAAAAVTMPSPFEPSTTLPPAAEAPKSTRIGFVPPVFGQALKPAAANRPTSGLACMIGGLRPQV
jgi:hypothetical protein